MRIIKKKIKHASRRAIGVALAATRTPLRMKRKKRELSRKILCAALAAGLVPYRFKIAQESGDFEVRGLLWRLKKEFDGEQHCCTVDLLPFLNHGEAPEAAPSGQAAPAPRT